MGENDVICWLMTASLDMLKRYFRDSQDIYVSSNSFVYYVEGDANQRVAPDLYIVKGVPNKQRLNYKIWEEGIVPQVVFEFTTESSRYKDLGTKKGLYEALGVKEYYLFDPAQEYLKPAFRAFCQMNGVLVEREQKAGYFSEELGLTIKPVGKLLRFFQPDSLQPIPTSEELEELADRLEEEVREKAQRVDQERLRADQEAARAKQEAARAEQEAARADELERRLKELQARLGE